MLSEDHQQLLHTFFEFYVNWLIYYQEVIFRSKSVTHFLSFIPSFIWIKNRKKYKKHLLVALSYIS